MRKIDRKRNKKEREKLIERKKQKVIEKREGNLKITIIHDLYIYCRMSE